ncbi:hypothetical protein ACHAWF_007066 [Thalassiosira exigua]
MVAAAFAASCWLLLVAVAPASAFASPGGGGSAVRAGPPASFGLLRRDSASPLFARRGALGLRGALSARGGSDEGEEEELRTVLVTGGAGYIGSHTCLELLSTGRYEVVVIDDLSNSSEESLERVEELLKLQGGKEGRLHFRSCDVRDRRKLTEVLEEFPRVSSCVHFAGLKAVGESVAKPLEYYDANVGGTAILLQALRDAGGKGGATKFVFSSSATVYGDPETLPLTEGCRLTATNPYGRTKLFVEEMLRDLYASDPEEWRVLILRYFNPIGAHPSGRMGEDPQGIPNNLMPFVAQVCVGRREKLSVFGDDYDTPDGTGVRDYIHVVDLARGHVAALDKLYSDADGAAGMCEAVNLGTGRGVSVLELVEGMGEATGTPVPYEIAERRPGDVAELYADPTKARELLGWEASLGTREMCEDTWRWQSTNPMGYRVEEEVEAEIASEN